MSAVNCSSSQVHSWDRQDYLTVPLTGRKLLPFQTEEPPLASSFVRSQIVGNSSVAYSRICLQTARSKEKRREQNSTIVNSACWPQDATAYPPTTAPSSQLSLQSRKASLQPFPVSDVEAFPFGCVKVDELPPISAQSEDVRLA